MNINGYNPETVSQKLGGNSLIDLPLYENNEL